MLLPSASMIIWALSIACIVSSNNVLGLSQDLTKYHSSVGIVDTDVVTVRSLLIYLQSLESVRHMLPNICKHSVFDEELIHCLTITLSNLTEWIPSEDWTYLKSSLSITRSVKMSNKFMWFGLTRSQPHQATGYPNTQLEKWFLKTTKQTAWTIDSTTWHLFLQRWVFHLKKHKQKRFASVVKTNENPRKQKSNLPKFYLRIL